MRRESWLDVDCTVRGGEHDDGRRTTTTTTTTTTRPTYTHSTQHMDTRVVLLAHHEHPLVNTKTMQWGGSRIPPKVGNSNGIFNNL
jgi:hypothetical protein